MFTVKWVVRGREDRPVEVEEFPVNGSDVLVQACLTRIGAMRLKYPQYPPSGFIVFDVAAKEVERRFSELD
jgi:hypothetical protein